MCCSKMNKCKSVHILSTSRQYSCSQLSQLFTHDRLPGGLCHSLITCSSIRKASVMFFIQYCIMLFVYFQLMAVPRKHTAQKSLSNESGIDVTTDLLSSSSSSENMAFVWIFSLIPLLMQVTFFIVIFYTLVPIFCGHLPF